MPEPYALDIHRDAKYLTSLLHAPVVQIAAHTSGHSPYIDLNARLGHGHERRTALGLWYVFVEQFRLIAGGITR